MGPRRHDFSRGSLAVRPAQARDLGFRYKDGTCVDAQGKAGLNPAFIGPCGDLRHVILARLDLSEMDLSGTRFDSSDLQETSFAHAILTGTNFSGVNLAGVDLTGAVIHDANFGLAILKNTHLAGADIVRVDFSRADFSGGQFSFLRLATCQLTSANFARATLDHADLSDAVATSANFTGATLTDANLQRSDMRGADLTSADLSSANLQNVNATGALFTTAVTRATNFAQATLEGVNFRAAKMDAAVLRSAKLGKADLRASVLTGAIVEAADWKGSVFNQRTVLPFSTEAAEGFGMLLQKGASLLIIVDDPANTEIADLKTYIESLGNSATLSTETTNTFTGAGLQGSSAVLLLNGQRTYEKDMPEAGQTALVDFVKAGGNFVYTELTTYSQQQLNFYKKMNDLVLLTYRAYTQGERSYHLIPGMEKHPILVDVAKTMMVKSLSMSGNLKQYAATADNPTPTQPVALLVNSNEETVVCAREFGRGHVVGLGFTSRFDNDSTLGDVTLRQLIVNGINW